MVKQIFRELKNIPCGSVMQSLTISHSLFFYISFSVFITLSPFPYLLASHSPPDVENAPGVASLLCCLVILVAMWPVL